MQFKISKYKKINNKLIKISLQLHRESTNLKVDKVFS